MLDFLCHRIPHCSNRTHFVETFTWMVEGIPATTTCTQETDLTEGHKRDTDHRPHTRERTDETIATFVVVRFRTKSQKGAQHLT
jgi:hypothetical protein